MLVGANTYDLRYLAASLLRLHTGVKPTDDFQAILWCDPDGNVEWVIGYDGFIGKCCQIHDVNLGGNYTPRALLRAAFDYPFNKLGMEMLLGVVNSNNARALAYNRKLGFTELQRLDGLHDEGGDIVLMKMAKADCKWLKERKHEELLVA